MKRAFTIFLMLYLILSLPGCATDHSPSSVTPSGGNTAAGFYYNSLEKIMADTPVYDWKDALVVVGRISDEPFSVRQAGDVRTVEVDQTIYGELPEEIGLLQTYEFQLDTSRTYLLILITTDPEDIIYSVAGSGEQAAFWIEDGELCGNNPDLVQEIRNDTAAKTYAANGETPDVNTMEGLADYFAARVAALE